MDLKSVTARGEQSLRQRDIILLTVDFLFRLRSDLTNAIADTSVLHSNCPTNGIPQSIYGFTHGYTVFIKSCICTLFIWYLLMP